ncbi:hypothetical protein A2642_01475 [Candidatus Nomurabacteria bacterium RIFCSPHIGHO2_01_FULL_39_10]|uniref:Uncharacterized protein n=1 Tax=Candidatus Nomurabacteria bacterium RIFCSPHIGHO2_01_FULL_39_10 TaxID=1801733 RepID=A0A1F6V6C3_9BACT|nr:MAG: hypothetical protein A2642_01475 [Candidatus Nomurabacteria bacterium RIFCSPHIGHO2_01_FULL_39_10]
MEKNIKDSGTETSISIKDMYFSMSYTKTHKLITALYMVTDIIDKEEPIRSKLRNLGTQIISDPEGLRYDIGVYGAGMSIMRIEHIISFLEIASAMNFISEMNCNILKKEFLELKESIQESIDMKPKWLADFFTNPLQSNPPLLSSLLAKEKGGVNSIGHKGQIKRTRIGVQKGSTLMKALSDKTHLLSNKNYSNLSKNNPAPHKIGAFRVEFDMLKKQRQDNIISIIKNIGGNAAIKDVMNKMNNNGEQESLSEKTLQRELISMAKNGVLHRTGRKRWSRYQLAF